MWCPRRCWCIRCSSCATGQEVLSGQIEPGVSASILLGLMIATFVIVALAIDRRSLLAPTLGLFRVSGDLLSDQ
jgi:hypothetical protein